MIFNLIIIHVDYDIGQITKCFSRLYSNVSSFELDISATFAAMMFIQGDKC